MAVRQIRDINMMSRSREMLPWNVSNSYNRPICRRIVEGSGVPRGKFGERKNATSVLFFERKGYLSPRSLNDYLSWLEQKQSYKILALFLPFGRYLTVVRPPIFRPILTALARGSYLVWVLLSLPLLQGTARGPWRERAHIHGALS
jgi:hypothetical protein